LGHFDEVSADLRVVSVMHGVQGLSRDGAVLRIAESPDVVQRFDTA
jgi:hypothetical protein